MSTHEWLGIRRSTDLQVFKLALYILSYLTVSPFPGTYYCVGGNCSRNRDLKKSRNFFAAVLPDLVGVVAAFLFKPARAVPNKDTSLVDDLVHIENMDVVVTASAGGVALSR